MWDDTALGMPVVHSVYSVAVAALLVGLACSALTCWLALVLAPRLARRLSDWRSRSSRPPSSRSGSCPGSGPALDAFSAWGVVSVPGTRAGLRRYRIPAPRSYPRASRVVLAVLLWLGTLLPLNVALSSNASAAVVSCEYATIRSESSTTNSNTIARLTGASTAGSYAYNRTYNISSTDSGTATWPAAGRWNHANNWASSSNQFTVRMSIGGVECDYVGTAAGGAGTDYTGRFDDLDDAIAAIPTATPAPYPTEIAMPADQYDALLLAAEEGGGGGSGPPAEETLEFYETVEYGLGIIVFLLAAMFVKSWYSKRGKV